MDEELKYTQNGTQMKITDLQYTGVFGGRPIFTIANSWQTSSHVGLNQIKGGAPLNSLQSNYIL